MTYSEGSMLADEYPANISPYHRRELKKARDFLVSLAGRHPEWVIRKARY